jgi:hypothetical protein
MHQNALKYQIMVDKQFNQNLHQPQLKMKIPIKIKLVVIIKMKYYLNAEMTYHMHQLK